MATFALIHGAADSAWAWHRLEPELQARGHRTVAMDLPCDDDRAGLADNVEAVLAATGEPDDLVVVGHSLGGFTAPLVCDRIPARALVLLAAMVPAPGETGGDWWENVGYPEDAGEGDEVEVFLHDLEPELAAEAVRRGREQSETPMKEPWPLAAWPDVETRYVLFRDDRFFPADWVRGMVADRLGIEADESPGGHCGYLSRPRELADVLDGYARAA